MEPVHDALFPDVFDTGLIDLPPAESVSTAWQLVRPTKPGVQCAGRSAISGHDVE